MRGGALWVLLGCAAAEASSPPVRGLHAAMPGLVSNRQLEVGVSLGGYSAPMLSPYASLQLTDSFAVETGLTGAVAPAWLTWWGGGRVTLQKGLGIALKLYSDVEVGGGLRGLYGGFGLGVRVAYFGFYLRGRAEWAEAGGAAGTLWPTLIVGAETRVAHHLVAWVAGGYAGRFTGPEVAHGVMAQAGVRYFFDVPL